MNAHVSEPFRSLLNAQLATVSRPVRRATPALTAKMTFEVEIEVSGTFQKGYPQSGPTYSSGGEPGQPDMIEDLDLEGFGALTHSFTSGKSAWTTTDLLAGVDRTSPAYQQIVANILAFVGDDAEQALLTEAGE